MQVPGFFYFSVITQTKKSKNWKYFKYNNVYLTDAFSKSYNLKTNLTELVYVRKEKNPKIKIFIPSLFQGEKLWNLKCKFKYGFSIALYKKTRFFDFKRKRYSEILSFKKALTTQVIKCIYLNNKPCLACLLI